MDANWEEWVEENKEFVKENPYAVILEKMKEV